MPAAPTPVRELCEIVSYRTHHGQPKPECAPLSFFAIHADLTSMQFDERFAYGQTETCPFLFSCIFGADLLESFKNSFPQVSRDAASLIDNLHSQPVSV